MDVNKVIEYDVYIGSKWIDTVYFTQDYTVVEVRDSLVNHDGYDSRIVVRKSR